MYVSLLCRSLHSTRLDAIVLLVAGVTPASEEVHRGGFDFLSSGLIIKLTIRSINEEQTVQHQRE
jgi:hypothetical protein